MKNITIQTIIIDETTNQKYKVTQVIAAELLRRPLQVVDVVMESMKAELLNKMKKDVVASPHPTGKDME